MIKVAWNYIKGYKRNTLVCMIGIMLAVMLIFSLVQMSGTIIAQYQNAMSGCAPFDWRIPGENIEEMDAIYDEIVEGLKSKEVWYATLFVEKTNTNGCFVGVEGDWKKTWGLSLIEGEEPKGAYELCVDEKFCEELGVFCGDEISLVLQDQYGAEFSTSFRIVGVLDTIPTPNAMYYLFTNVDTAKKVIAQEGYFYSQDGNFVSVLFDEKDSLNQTVDEMFRLQNKFGTEILSRIIYNEEKEKLLQEKEGYFNVAGSFYAVVGGIALCMIIFVYNTINISLTERLRQYGTLRSLGISNRGLLGILFMEELLYTSGGLILGIIAGRLLNGIVAEYIIYWVMGIEIEKNEQYPWLYLLVIGITLLAVLVATVVTVLRISGKTPMELVKYMEKLPKRIKRGKRKNFLVEMVNRNMQRNASKSRILFVTIMLAAFLIIAIGNIAGTMNLSLEKSLYTAADIQIQAEYANMEKLYISEEDRLQCEAIEGVEQVYWLVKDFGYQCFWKDKEIVAGIYVYSDAWMEKFLKYNGLEKFDIQQEELAFVLKNENSQQMDIQVADYIHLERKDGTDNFFQNRTQSYDIEVNGILNDSISNLIGMGNYLETGDYIVINEALGEKILGSISYYSSLFLECEKDIDANTVRRDLDEWEYVYYDLNNAVEDTERQLMGIVALCVYLLVAVVILAIFIIQNIIKANFHARLKEVGMLRSIGAEEKLIKHLLCGEIMINSIKATVFGGILASIVSVYFYYMSYNTWGVGLMGYLIGIPAVLFGCYLVASLAIKRSLKTSICNLIKYE